jgi:hypothetical protein
MEGCNWVEPCLFVAFGERGVAWPQPFNVVTLFQFFFGAGEASGDMLVKKGWFRAVEDIGRRTQDLYLKTSENDHWFRVLFSCFLNCSIVTRTLAGFVFAVVLGSSIC